MKGDSVKLYDGRGKRFKRLIDPKEIMDEHGLKLTEVLPKHARDKWYAIWFRWGFGFAAGMSVWGLAFASLYGVLDSEFVSAKGVFTFLIVVSIMGIFIGGIAMLVGRRWTWKTYDLGIRTLAQRGFCPSCGYIIRGTPADEDGCTPCSECGHAWVVEDSER